jgi:formylglycine-generating enzyme required for sulfatase activity
MCTGRLPFKGADAEATLLAARMTEPSPPALLNPEVPAGLSNLVMKLLRKDPARRPTSAQEAADALQALASDCTTSPPAAPPQATLRGRGRKLLGIGLAAAAGAALVAAIVLFWQTPHGAVRLESDDPGVEIVFDQTGPTIKGADKEPITLRAGEHGILIKRGDFTFEADTFVLRKGETLTLKLELLKGKLQFVRDGQVTFTKDVPLPPKFTNELGMKFVRVPRGKSWLGGGGGKVGEQEVNIPYDFYLGTYEVTQGQWRDIMKRNPSIFSRRGPKADAVKDVSDDDLQRFPVEAVSWNAAQVFLKQLNERVQEAGWVYRLPTAVEWEYACRGGPMTDRADSAFHCYVEKPTNDLQLGQASFGRSRPCKVGSFKPNRLGLYDMHGNVWEWCEDAEPAEDGTANRVYRGGCWGDLDADNSRASFHFATAPNSRREYIGLRVARAPAGVTAVSGVVPVPSQP